VCRWAVFGAGAAKDGRPGRAWGVVVGRTSRKKFGEPGGSGQKPLLVVSAAGPWVETGWKRFVEMARGMEAGRITMAYSRPLGAGRFH
jgi:hypothetical protein